MSPQLHLCNPFCLVMSCYDPLRKQEKKALARKKELQAKSQQASRENLARALTEDVATQLVCSSLLKSYITRPPLVPLQSPLSPLLGALCLVMSCYAPLRKQERNPPQGSWRRLGVDVPHHIIAERYAIPGGPNLDVTARVEPEVHLSHSSAQRASDARLVVPSVCRS